MDSRSETITRIANKYSRRLIAYARLVCGDLETARDAAADTFLKLCAMEEIDETRIAAWLYRSCRNRAIDIVRRRKFRAEFDDGELEKISDETSLSVVGSEMRRQYLLSLIAALPANQREILMLRFFVGLEYCEISEVMEIPMGSIGTTISRALKNIKQQMLSDNEYA